MDAASHTNAGASSILLTEYGDDEGCFTFKHQMRNKEIRGNLLELQVSACGVSYLDLEMKNGKYKNLHGPLPHVLGYEITGRVCRIGEDVSRFSVGDSVAGFVPMDQAGGNGDFVTIAENCLVHKPNNVGCEDVTGAITAGIRGETALHSCSRLSAGDSILILDGGLFDQQISIQLALYRGLSVFTTITSKDTKIPASISEKAQVIDLTEQELSEAIIERTSGLGVDIILEAPSYFTERSISYQTSQIIKCLASQGTWITSRSVQIDPPASHVLLLKSAKISYLFEQTWVLSGSQQGRFLHLFKDLMQRLEQGDVSCHVDKTFKMDRISDAHAYFLANTAQKIVLLP
uniref:Enoyl reductase (ER) domain-containing protein n=1 Tax=Vannella robusta TaxID=1487602 RepID=A0A6U1VW20_9EUKA|mmetsp:Transcript_24699/g.31428  ORF Transcript_24699/g.31428 Transcript_24699/m.31428 type:complete len:347 (+) Transcript_24699:322-1362(+)